MFDAETRLLIEKSPKLKDLNLEELSEDLSRFYTHIISLRTQDNYNLDQEEIFREIDRLKRLANTYEALILTKDNHPLKDSAAFVAATAYNYISNLELDSEEFAIDDKNPSTAVSSMLLFFIAGYFSDAQSIAKTLNIKKNIGIRKDVLKALIFLVNGDYVKLANIPITKFELEDYEIFEAASINIWVRIIKFVQSLGLFLRGKELENIDEEINGILEDCVLNLDSKFTQQSGFYIFRGHYHIAKLLKACVGPIRISSVALVTPPTGVSGIKWKGLTRRLSTRRPFLWRNHVEAVDKGFLENGTSSVISFPTGAGKSTLSELKIGSTLATGKSVIFLAPTNALLNQVIRDLKIAFPSNRIRRAISNTGEYSHVDLPADLRDADISVMTPEKCLTQLRQSPEAFSNVGLLIFDECHLMHSSSGKKSRNIDSMLGLLYFLEVCPNSDILLISAMIDNVNDLSDWLETKFKKKTLALKIEWKPTRQIRGCVVYNSEEIKKIENEVKKTISTKSKPNLYAKAFAHFSLQQQWSKNTSKKKYSLSSISAEKVELGLTNKNLPLASNKVKVAASIGANLASRGIKTLLFIQNPIWAKSAAKETSKHKGIKAIEFTKEEKELIEKATLEIGNKNYLHLPIDNKTAFHFGDMIEFERNLSESCFSRYSGLNLLAATNTLAQGLNLPAEAVIIVGNDRFDNYSNENSDLDAHELLNAAGRAGRAGFNSQGIVIVIPSQVITFKVNEEDYNLSKYWESLRLNVFSKADNCLTVVDPLTNILDKVNIESEKELDNILYLIQRMPLEKSEASLKAFFNKSFGAYVANKNGESIESHLETLILYRNEAQVTESELIWLVSISYKYGVDYKVVASLNSYLGQIDLYEKRGIQEWIDIFFNWLYTDSTLIVALFTRTDIIDFFKIGKEKRSESEILDLLSKAIEVWIKGVNYFESSDILGLELKSNLSKIRKLFLKVIPELSYYFGLIPQLYIGRAEFNNLEVKLPLELSILTTCIREGFDNPFKLAIQTLFKEENEKSRTEVHQLYDKFEGFLPEILPDDEFFDLVKYVKNLVA